MLCEEAFVELIRGEGILVVTWWPSSIVSIFVKTSYFHEPSNYITFTLMEIMVMDLGILRRG